MTTGDMIDKAPKRFNATLRFMRIACPAMIAATSVVVYCAWQRELYFLVAINAVLLGINAVLTWIQWTIFELKGERNA